MMDDRNEDTCGFGYRPPAAKPRIPATLRERVGAAIRTLRKEKGLTLCAVANRMDPPVTIATLSEFERAIRSANLSTIERVSKALGVTPLRILELAENL